MAGYDENYRCYGARKMWLHLRQAGHEVARCTVGRLMKVLGLLGARRGKAKRTTVADPAAARAKDLVNRDFAPLAPNRLRVADFTYVSTLAGWVYVAFVIDAYARRILGWKVSASMTTDLVLAAINQAIFTRKREGVKDLTGLIHHNDAVVNIRRCGSPTASLRKGSTRRPARSVMPTHRVRVRPAIGRQQIGPGADLPRPRRGQAPGG